MEEKELIPATIWHYTDLAGFLHIMQEGSWFYGTHYRHLSDNQECLRAKEIFDEEIENNGIKPIKNLHLFQYFTYYISCFSTSNNIKQLWEDNLFCVGFSSNEIKKQIRLFNMRHDLFSEDSLCFGALEKKSLFHAKYDEDSYRNLIRERILYLRKTCDFHNEFNVPTDADFEFAHLRYLANAILKASKYRYEKEVRLVYYLNDADRNIEIISHKPRIKMFQIDHKKMIKEIIIKKKGNNIKSNRLPSDYKKFIKLCCECVNATPAIRVIDSSKIRMNKKN